MFDCLIVVNIRNYNQSFLLRIYVNFKGYLTRFA